MATKKIRVVYEVNDQQLIQAKKTIEGTEASTKKADSAMKQLDKDAQKAGDGASKSFLSLNNIIAGLSFAAVASGLKSIISESIKVTSEFQKLAAVLTNTLGSNAAAQKALQDIKDFAAKTPFSVQELTASFVKLANSGFKPTTAELTKLGDLASSQGKSFDQLTEAIIDAQTGEFERLKEFGIRAQKEGDKVSFTFKGVKEQVDFTADSIQNYILKLGEANGVTGGMAAISETLGGKISNLGDGWDNFLATLGEGNSGALSGTVSLLQKALEIATDLVKTEEQSNKELTASASSGLFDRYKALGDENKQLAYKEQLYKNLLTVQIAIAKSEKIQAEFNKGITTEDNPYLKDLKLRRESLEKTIELIRNLNEEQSKSTQSAPSVFDPKLMDKLGKDANKIFNDWLKRIIEDEKKLGEEAQKDREEAKESDIKRAEERAKEIGDIDQDQVKAAYDLIQEQKKAYEDAEKAKEDAARRAEENILAARRKAADIAINIASYLAQKKKSGVEEEIAAEEYAASQAITLAGDNKKLKEEIEIKSQQKLEALRVRQEQEQKERDKRRILIDGLVSIAKTFAQFGYPAGILPAALMAAQTAIMVQTVGQYKDGEVDIQGPGTSRSDSINARISKGESVINAAATSRSKNLLTAINEKRIDDRILSNLRVGSHGIIAQMNDERIVKAIEGNRMPSLARDGYTLMETIQVQNGFKKRVRSKII